MLSVLVLPLHPVADRLLFLPCSAWEAFVDLQDGFGFRKCGTWELAPPTTAVKTVVMDHILRIVMD